MSVVVRMCLFLWSIVVGKQKNTKRLEKEFFTFVLVIAVWSDHGQNLLCQFWRVGSCVQNGLKGASLYFVDDMLSESRYAQRGWERWKRFKVTSSRSPKKFHWIIWSHVTDRVASISSKALMWSGQLHLSVSNHPGHFLLFTSLQTSCFGVQVAFTDLLLQV